MNFYHRYPGDYMRDTKHLSLAEHGAYSLLLDTYFSTEEPLPRDYDGLYRICSAMTKAEKASVKSVVDQFFPVAQDGKRHNKRADRVIAEAQPKILAAQENGRRGGRPKNQDETKEEPNGLPIGLSGGTQDEPNGKAHLNQNHILNQTPKPDISGEPDERTPGSIAFASYSQAYQLRYREKPVQNAKVNSIFKNLASRLSAEEAPKVAAFYVSHSNWNYVNSGHCPDLLLRDAEKLRTEWATGNRITTTGARQADRKQNNADIAQRLLDEASNG